MQPFVVQSSTVLCARLVVQWEEICASLVAQSSTGKCFVHSVAILFVQGSLCKSLLCLKAFCVEKLLCINASHV